MEYQPERIQQYCRALMADALPELEALGYQIEPETGRGYHLLGVWVPANADSMALSRALLTRNVSVSARDRAIRVSPNVYNTPNDVQALVTALREVQEAECNAGKVGNVPDKPPPIRRFNESYVSL